MAKNAIAAIPTAAKTGGPRSTTDSFKPILSIEPIKINETLAMMMTATTVQTSMFVFV